MKSLLLIFALSSSFCFADEDAAAGLAGISTDRETACETGSHCFKDVNFHNINYSPDEVEKNWNWLNQGTGKGNQGPAKAKREEPFGV